MTFVANSFAALFAKLSPRRFWSRAPPLIPLTRSLSSAALCFATLYGCLLHRPRGLSMSCSSAHQSHRSLVHLRVSTLCPATIRLNMDHDSRVSPHVTMTISAHLSYVLLSMTPVILRHPFAGICLQRVLFISYTIFGISYTIFGIILCFELAPLLKRFFMQILAKVSHSRLHPALRVSTPLRLL